MDMMALAVRMQVFGIVHGHARHQIKSKEVRVVCHQCRRKSRAVLFHGGDCPDLNAAQRKGGLMFRLLQPIGRPAVVMVELFLVVASDWP